MSFFSNAVGLTSHTSQINWACWHFKAPNNRNSKSTIMRNVSSHMRFVPFLNKEKTTSCFYWFVLMPQLLSTKYWLNSKHLTAVQDFKCHSKLEKHNRRQRLINSSLSIQTLPNRATGARNCQQFCRLISENLLCVPKKNSFPDSVSNYYHRYKHNSHQLFAKVACQN